MRGSTKQHRPQIIRIICLSVIMLLYGCGPSPDEQAQAQLSDAVRKFSESQNAKAERLNDLIGAINNLLQTYKTSNLAKELIRGEPIIQGKSFDELKNELAVEESALDYSKYFLTLVTKQCIQNITDPAGLKSKLENDKSYRTAPALMGTFETRYKNVSFAVTPDAENCIVDIMLASAHHDSLFQLHHIDEMLKSVSELSEESFVEDTDFANNGDEVLVLKKKYQVKNGPSLMLVYPVSGLDKYYMHVDVTPTVAPNHLIQPR